MALFDNFFSPHNIWTTRAILLAKRSYKKVLFLSGRATKREGGGGKGMSTKKITFFETVGRGVVF